MHPETSSFSSQALPHRLTKFIGRDIELVELRRLLHERRLVTLIGAGGSGKTRLALEFASLAAPDFPDGVIFVELAPLSSPHLVVEVVARALNIELIDDISLLDALTRCLSNRKSLLVLDNCEHVLNECAKLAGALTAACANLCLLATSREPLGIGGECFFRVPLLSLPGPGFLLDPKKLADFESVQLFTDRARLVNPAFTITDSNVEAVAEICTRLDGMPLALELAAASLRAFSVQQLASRLNQRFSLLTSSDSTALPRQRTLGAMLDWSYALLAPTDQVVFRRLAVFPGDWTLDAAEDICAHERGDGKTLSTSQDGVLGALIHLVDKSLVQFDAEVGRYHMLETIRLYATTRLVAAGEKDDIATRHLESYLRFVEEGGKQQGTSDQHAWYMSLEAERDNLRAALGLAVDKRLTEQAARLALALLKFWIDRAYHSEGLRWLEQILALDSVVPLDPGLKARILSAAGTLAHNLNRFEAAKRYHSEALQLWRTQDDDTGIATALLELGWQGFQAVDLDAAERYGQESLALARKQDDLWAIGAALNLLGVSRAESGRSSEAIPVLKESLGIWRSLDALDQVAAALMSYGRAEAGLGNFGHACDLLLEALRLQMRLGTYTGLIGCLSIMVNLGRDACPPPEKYIYLARTIGVFETLQEKIGGGTSRWHEREAGPLYGEVAEQLGEDGLASELAVGRALTIEGILALAEEIVRLVRAAIAIEAQSRTCIDSRASKNDYPAGLTSREVEVLRLVAGGLTNQQAATRLSVTPRTINAHLTSIYSKIGVTSRAGAIRFALEQSLI